jgi:hypothetical protein
LQRGPARIQPAAPEIRERALAGFVLGGLALIGALMMGRFHPQRGVYVLAVSLAFAVLAVWLCLNSAREARRSGTMRPRTVTAGAVFGWIALAIGVLWGLALIVFWSQLTTYSDCMDSANTVTASQACQTQLTNSIGNQLNLLHGN